ncbi:MAG: exodeoxyribonuclease VII large subunit, partial [Phycisphaerae bacterium]
MSSGKTGSGRQPFDPRRVRGAATGGGLFGSTARGEGGGDADPATLTVSQLTRMVKAAIEKGIPADLHVIGELSNVKRSANGHLYFTMKDSSSEVRCVMWRTSARSLRFDLKDGLEVVATGSVEVYEPRGQYQLMVRRMEPRGVGALELAFSQLKERLGREGLFDAGRKRSLIAIPRTLAVVTSPTGAAIRDIIQTIRRRYPRVRVLVFGVRVQGDGAAEEIADAIRRINHECARLGGVDVMIVGRGGGSLEDLWAFNEEIVARAIFASEIPVINAVGHEIDFTIADFVADVRAATPTAAAELAVPELGTLLDDLDASGRRLRQAIRRSIDTAHSRLSIVEHSPWFRDPLGQIRRRQQWADEVSGRQTLAVSRRFGRIRSALQSLELRLAQVRPAAQLARR